MLYFSEIKNKKVVTEDNIEVGKLADLIFSATENPKTTKLSIKNAQNQELIVPISFLKKTNSHIVLEKNYLTQGLDLNELYVGKHLLDRQIIDIKGNKVVRVNDILIQDKQDFLIAGVDASFLGVMRWFNMDNLARDIIKYSGIHYSPNILSWADIQPLELVKGKVILKKEVEKLENMNPEDLADYLEKTNIISIRKILNILDEEFAAEVIGNLNVNYQNELFKHFSPRKAARVISFIDPDEAVDILLTLSKRRREKIIYLLSDDKRKEIEYLLKLSRTPIGELITTEYLSVTPELTSRQVFDLIKSRTADLSWLNYIYAVNSNKQLVGVFNTHELIMQNLDTPVYKFMVQNVAVIHLTTPKEIALKKMLKYKLQALPVIDNNKQILGIVTFDDMAEFIMSKI